jgi:hypothetical protein
LGKLITSRPPAFEDKFAPWMWVMMGHTGCQGCDSRGDDSINSLNATEDDYMEGS